jgi:hypothetical protein
VPGLTTATTTAAPEPKAKPASKGSPQAQITKAIEGVLVSGDAAVACGTAVTPSYVVRAYGDRTACAQAQLPGSTAKSVKVSGIKISGNRATAIAVPAGGPSSGEKVTVKLVDRAGWRVEALKSHVPVGP